MAVPCPHCAALIDGFVPIKRLEEAAATRDEIIKERDTLKATVKETQKKAALYDALAPEFDRVNAELEAVAPLKAEMEALRKERVDGAYTSVGITDPKIRRIVELDFDEQKDADDGVKDIAAFLGKVKGAPPAHLAPFFKPAATVAVQVATPAATPRPNALPVVTPANVATPPAPGAKLTPQQISAQLAEINQRYAPNTLPTDPTQRAARIAERNAAVEALKSAAHAPTPT
jgi:hypothetical protein